MFKREMFIVCVGMLIFGTFGLSYSQQDKKDAVALATAQPVNLGNKICPVSGEQIIEETKVTYEYEGKIYNFCCPMCIDGFKKDPDKYIKKIEEGPSSESRQHSH
jgi:P-type Cu+ transporter